MPPQLLATLMPPGGFRYRQQIKQMLQFGHNLRTEYLWQYPFLPEAVMLYQEIVASREFQIVSRTPRAGARAMEYIINAETWLSDGTTEYGFEQYLKRKVIDHLCIGRTLAYHKHGKSPFRYIDPYQVWFDWDKRKWINPTMNEEYKEEDVMLNHVIPIASDGQFISPLLSVIPKAMMAWLVNEHDMAAADGRKIRDILIVVGEELHDQIQGAVQQALELWSGANPRETGAPVVWVDPIQGMTAGDFVAHMGIANIPSNFDRPNFEFGYANSVANATGLPIRSIYNSEKATNRALEEVQETRAGQKGPNAFIRTEERLINQTGALDAFGDNIRFQFVEEADLASRETNATVMKTYVDAFKVLVDTFATQVDPEYMGKLLDSLTDWLKSESALPPDLELLSKYVIMKSDTANANDGIINSDSLQTTTSQSNSVVRKPSANPTAPGAPPPATKKNLDYGEFIIDRNCKVVEKRVNIMSLAGLIEDEIDRKISVAPVRRKGAFMDALQEARSRNLAKYFSIDWTQEADADIQGIISEIPANRDELTSEHFGLIRRALALKSSNNLANVDD